MTLNRKRGRNMKEDEMEFMPLSKRINNLHINNSLLGIEAAGQPQVILHPDQQQGHGSHHVHHQQHQHHHPGQAAHNQLPFNAPGGSSSASSSSLHVEVLQHHQQQEWQNAQTQNPVNHHLDAHAYNPELTETQNPYYFNINKLLFEMYLERQQRVPHALP